MPNIRHSLLLLSLAGFVSCKTSGDVVQDPAPNTDPVGVRTLDAPPSVNPKNTGEASEPARSGAPRANAQELERQLEVAQGELENLRFQIEKERQEWQLKNVENEAEKKKLQEALAARSPSEPVATSDTGASADKGTAELLWKQSVESIRKNADADALTSLKSLIANYPKSKRLWGATLTAGMVEYRTKNFKGAAIHFNQAIDTSGKRNVGPALAWYFQGLSFLKMDKKEDATLFFGELDRRFAKTKFNIQAKKILAHKAKPPADLFDEVPNWLDFVGP